MYCCNSIPLYNGGEINTHTKYYQISIYRNGCPSTAEPFPWVPLEHMQKKILFFFNHPPPRFQLPIFSTEMINSKQEKKRKEQASPFSSSFHVSAEKKRKRKKVCWQIRQKVRAEREGDGKDGVLLIYHNSKLFSIAPITSSDNNKNNNNKKQTFFLGIFSTQLKKEKKSSSPPPPLQERAPLMQIRLPHLPLASTIVEKKYIFVW